METLETLQQAFVQARDFPVEFFGEDPDKAIKAFQIRCHPDRWEHNKELVKSMFTTVSGYHREFVAGDSFSGFKICRKLARGNMCDVYLAWSEEHGHIIAKRMRIFAPELLEHELAVLEIFRESLPDDKLQSLCMIPEAIHLDIDRNNKNATLFVTRGLAKVPLTELLNRVGMTAIPGTAVVWMFRKTMIILSHLHNANMSHGAVTPEHILVEPSTHDVQLCGMVHAAKFGKKFRMVPEGRADYYPPDAKDYGHSRGLDVYQAAKSLLDMAVKPLPGPIHGVLAACLLGPAARPWPDEAEKLMREAAFHAYGPPKFVMLPEAIGR